MKLLLNRKIHTGAYKLFVVFFVLFYVVPALGLIIFYEEYRVSYNINGGFLPLLIVPITLILVYIFDLVLPRIKNKTNWIGNLIFNDYLLLLFASVFLLTSIYFYQNFSISFRQKESISDGGFIIIIMFALRALFKVVILYFFFISVSGENINQYKRTILMMIFIGYILSINSSFDVIFIAMMFTILFDKTKILIANKSSNPTKVLFSLLLLGTIVILISFIGIANKIGMDSAYSLFSDLGLIEAVILHILKRLSTHFISIITSGQSYYNDLHLVKELFQSLFMNLVNRVYILFGSLEVSKPEIWSVNRLNYLRLFQEIDNEKTGSSPGIFASVFYFPDMILGLAVISFYLIKILRKFSDLFMSLKHVKVNFIGYFILLFFLMALLESPLDLINLLSPSFIFFFFFIFIPTK